MEYIFHPRSVAVVGASSDPRRGGNGFLAGFRDMGFPGPIYPVNPKATEIMGLPAYPSIADIPGPVDYVVFSVPATAALEVLEQCVAKQTQVVHLFTAGFHETFDQERADLEQRLIATARRGGVRIIGPNCMGVYCPRSGLSFSSSFPKEPGNIAFISQSGQNASELVGSGQAWGLRFSKVVSYGNGADLNEADFMECVAADPETQIIAAYIEGVKDGPRFFAAAREAARSKPVIILKGGRTEAGSRAVASHTGSLAGEDRIFDAFCRQAGVVRVYALEELMEALGAFRFMRPPRGRRACIIGVGGGASVLAADECASWGLEVPWFSEEVRRRLAEFTPIAGTSVRNPLDTVGMGRSQDFYRTLEIVSSSGEVDFILTTVGGGWGREPQPSAHGGGRESTLDALVRFARETGTPVGVILRQGIDPNSWRAAARLREECWQAGLPVFGDIRRAARAISRFLDYHLARR